MPFKSRQFTPEQAKEYGLDRDSAGRTYFRTEAQLNRWLSGERAKGRDVGWKDTPSSHSGAPEWS